MNADAISDLILAVVAFSIAFVQLRQRPALAIGCGLIGGSDWYTALPVW